MSMADSVVDSTTAAQPQRLIDMPLPPGFNVIKEGTARVLVPQGNKVFYNNVQEFNRDVSILVISQFSDDTMMYHSMKAKDILAKRALKEAAAAENDKANITTTDNTTQIQDDTTTKNKKHRPSAPLSSEIATELPPNDHVLFSPATPSIPCISSTDMPSPTASDDDNKHVSLLSTTTATPVERLSNGLPTCYSDNISYTHRYKGVRIFEALAASGLRSIRYWNEIPYVDTIHVNDLDTEAIASIKRNLKYNEIPLHRVFPNKNEATAALYANRHNNKELLSKIGSHQTILPPRPDTITDNDPLAFLYDNNTPTTPTTSLGIDEINGLRCWNVIDLDPYGSAVPFLDAAVQAIDDNGLLCVTCTDAAILCGNYPETGYGRYSAVPIPGMFNKEMGLRLLLHSISISAAKYGRVIVPLLSLSIDFYMRVFVKVTTSPLRVKHVGSQHSLVYQCVQCHTYHTQPMMNVTSSEPLPSLTALPVFGQPLPPAPQQPKSKYSIGSQLSPHVCTLCSGRIRVGGPIWSDPIHDPEFIQRCLNQLERRSVVEISVNKKSSSTSSSSPSNIVSSTFGTYKRIYGMLSMAKNELSSYESILYYDLPLLSQIVRLSTPPLDLLLSCIYNSNKYTVSETHCAPSCIKTDAPVTYIYDIFKAIILYNNGYLNKTWSSLSYLPRQIILNNKNIINEKGDNISIEYTDDEIKQYNTYKTLYIDNIKNDDISTDNNMNNDNNDTLTQTQIDTDKIVKYLNATHLSSRQKFSLWSQLPDKNIIGQYILSQPMTHNIDMRPHQRNKVVMFYYNPEAHWGPKAMAGGFEIREFEAMATAEARGDGNNIASLLGKAQHEKAIANQGRIRDKKRLRSEAAAALYKQQQQEQQKQQEEGQLNKEKENDQKE